MKISLKTLVNSFTSLKEVSGLKFTANRAFEIAKFLNKISEEMQTYEKIRMETALKFSSDKKQVDENKMDSFLKEINELLIREIEIPDFHFTKQDFEGKDLTPEQIINLNWLIK